MVGCGLLRYGMRKTLAQRDRIDYIVCRLAPIIFSRSALIVIYTAPDALGCVLVHVRISAAGKSAAVRSPRITLDDVAPAGALLASDLDAQAAPNTAPRCGRAGMDTINTMPALKEYSNGKG